MGFKDTVFSRTTEGEARARQPRSISSLELRATLLLVDGKLSVRELKHRFGASLEIEASVDELHRQGLISSLGQKVGANANVDVAAERSSRPSLSIVEASAPLVVRIDDRPVATRAEPPTLRPFDATARGDAGVESPTSEPETANRERHGDALDQRFDEGRREPQFNEMTPEPDMIGTSEPEINEDALTQANAMNEAPVEEAPERGPNLADRARGGALATRFFIGRAARGLMPVLTIGLIAALVVMAFLLPERYREVIEAQAAAQLGHRVQFSALRLSASGGGSLQLSNVRAPALGEWSAANVYIAPDFPASLDALAWRFSVKVDALRGRPAALSALLSAPWRSERIAAVSLEGVTALVGDERWSGFDGTVDVTQTPRVARLHSDERRVVAEVTPNNARLALDVVAVNQALRVFPDIRLDTYQLTGTLGDADFDASAMGAGVFGGKLTASGQLTWRKGAVLAATVTLGRIEIDRLFKAIGAGLRVDGAINGDFKLAARAAHPSEIRAIDTLTGDFVVDNGTLFGMDFGAALRERGAGSIQGGETRFDSLSGRLVVNDRSARVTIRNLDAGALDGHGEITIGALEALSGRLSAAVGANSRRVRMPVMIAGSLAAPVLEVRAPLAPKPVHAASADAPISDGPADVGGPELQLEVPVAPGDLR